MTDEEEGLLIYKDGTVCDDSFSDNSADAICREMGFHAALSWRNGYFYNVQQTARAIRLDNVACSSNVWAACSYSETHNCNHHEDVHISCELGLYTFVNNVKIVTDETRSDRISHDQRRSRLIL